MGSSPALSLPQPNKLPPIPKLITTTERIPGTIFLSNKCQTLQEVRQLHAQLVVSGLLSRRPTAGKLIESYLSTSHIYSASSVFNTIESPDVFAYNTMIRGLTVGSQPYNSLLLYNRMLLNGLIPDNYTYTFVLKACSFLCALFEGEQVHCQIIKAGIAPDTHVHSSLIHMYANSDGLDMAQHVLAAFLEENTLVKNSMISGYFRHGCTEKARKLFDEMKDKDDASWSAMVSGYTKNGMYIEALGVFREMMVSGVEPNESTLVSALSACARLGTLEQGRSIHKYVDRTGANNMSVILRTALVEMYAKSGSIDSSYEVFRKMPTRDVVTWGAMISGFAMHGQAEKCFQLLDEMTADKIYPNAVIYVAILAACSHVGYVEEGYHYFNQMVQSFGIKPAIEHYGCMVDLLGRAGRLAEAEELIVSMPEDPNSVIWGALLAACRTHKDLRRGKRAFKCLIELEPISGDRYKLAGHMFAATGKQEDAIRARKFIREKEMETTCGSSFIEVDGIVHEFMVGDIDHNKAREIYVMLEEINRRLDKTGLIGRRKELLLGIGQDEEQAISSH